MIQTYRYTGKPGNFYTPGQIYELEVQQTYRGLFRRPRVDMWAFRPYPSKPGVVLQFSRRSYRNWTGFKAEWETP